MDHQISEPGLPGDSSATLRNLLIARYQIIRLETATGKTVKCMRSDNGGGFEGKLILDFLRTNRIKAEQFLPYHHYQNGAIERYNRTVSDMGRAILTYSEQPVIFIIETRTRLERKKQGEVR